MLFRSILEKFFSDDQKESIEREVRLNKEYNEHQKKINSTISRPKKYKNRVRTLLTALKAYNIILSLGAISKKRTNTVYHVILHGVSLGIFKKTSLFRIKMYEISQSYIFRGIGYILVVINSIILTQFTSLHNPDDSYFKAFQIVSYVYTGFFIIETCIKIISGGLIMNGDTSFLRSGINILDLIATISNLVREFTNIKLVIARRLLILLEVFRIFRFMTINRGFRLKTQAIIRGIPKMLKIIAIAFTFIWVFSLIGIQLFKGLFHYCSKNNVDMEVEIITMYDCMNHGGDWLNYDIHFDNIYMAGLTLFEMFTGKSWCSIITYVQDLDGYNLEPKRNVSPYHLWFPVLYMVISYLFMRSLLIGSINNTFYYYNEELQGLRELTVVQRRWVSLSRIIFKASPIKHYDSGCRFYPLYTFLTRKAFKYFITSTIGLNGIVFCITVYRPNKILEKTCEIIYYIILAIYLLEIILKVIFYRKDYFKSGWNLFDFICALCILLFTILTSFIDNHYLLMILYVFRSVKICSLFQKFEVLRELFQIFALALPSVINLALMLFVMMYIFAVIGITLFSTVKLQNALNEHANFKNLYTAFFTIYRIPMNLHKSNGTLASQHIHNI